MTSQFTLKKSALLYPAAGFEPEEDHFGVLLDGQEVGTIYRVGDEWLWSISIWHDGQRERPLRQPGGRQGGFLGSLGRAGGPARAGPVAARWPMVWGRLAAPCAQEAIF
ncbi:hypothetical protein V1282_005403 [Nitrobacteraceae bacterium AZCC 2146]